jgi:hypothetical protein
MIVADGMGCLVSLSRRRILPGCSRAALPDAVWSGRRSGGNNSKEQKAASRSSISWETKLVLNGFSKCFRGYRPYRYLRAEPFSHDDNNRQLSGILDRLGAWRSTGCSFQNQTGSGYPGAVCDGAAGFWRELCPGTGQKSSAAAADIRWHFIGHLQTNKVKQLDFLCPPDPWGRQSAAAKRDRSAGGVEG